MKTKITSKLPISSGNMNATGMLIFSILFLGAGGYICAGVFKVVPFEGKMNAPREIILACGLIFFLAGLLVFIQALLRLKNDNKLKNYKRRSTNSPWLWDYQWKQRGVSNRSNNSLVGHIIGVSIVSLFLMMTYWLGFLTRDGFKLPFYGMCFFLLIILFWFYTMISKRIRYGKPYLRFNSFPFKSGDEMKLTFTGLPPKDKVEEVIINLRFYEEVFLKNHKGQTRISLNEKYIQSSEYPATAISSQRELDVSLLIPKDVNFSNSISSMPASFWEVQIQCDIKGWDYREYFLLPIYN